MIPIPQPPFKSTTEELLYLQLMHMMGQTLPALYTTPPAPTVTADDVNNTLVFSHGLGDSEIVVSENYGNFVPYTGPISVGDLEKQPGYWRAKIKAGTNRNESPIVESPLFTNTGTINTTPAAPTVSFNSQLRILSATHALGTSEIVYSTNNGSYQPYTGGLSIDGNAYSLNYWKFKIKAASGRNESSVAGSPAISAAGSGNEAKMVVISGQSNAVGYAPIPDLSLSPLNQFSPAVTREFQRVKIWNPTTSTFEKLLVDVNNLGSEPEKPAGYPNGFGAEIGLAQRWEDENPTGTLYIVKSALGATSISQHLKGTSLYTQMLNRMTAAKAELTGLGLTPQIVGLEWAQGESDSGMSDASYTANLTQLITDWQTDGVIEATTKRAIIEIRTAAQENYVNSDAHAVLLPNAEYTRMPEDGVHFDAPTQLFIGGTQLYNAVFGTTGELIIPTENLNGSALTLFASQGSNSTSVWEDQSGNNYDVTQPSAGVQPTIIPAALNSKPAYGFNGGQYLSVPELNATPEDYVITVALKSTSAAQQFVFDAKSDGTSPIGEDRIALLVGGSSAYFNNGNYYGSGIDASNPTIITWLLYSTGVTIRVNGVIVDSGLPYNKEILQGVMNLGASIDGSSGFIGEKYAFDIKIGQKTANSIYATETAMATEYGITIATPPPADLENYLGYFKSYLPGNTPENWVNQVNPTKSITQTNASKQWDLQEDVLNGNPAYYMDGLGDHTTARTMNVPPLKTIAGKLTLQYAVMPEVAAGMFLFCSDSNERRLILGAGSYFEVYDGISRLNSIGQLPAGQLCVVTYVLDDSAPGASKAYVNNTLAGAFTCNAIPLGNQNPNVPYVAELGKMTDYAGDIFKGHWFGKLVYNGVLTDTEILANVNMFRTDLGLTAL